jgi:hypothetical protein
MAIRISRDLRIFYADKTFALTNIGAGATLFGQFFSDDGFSWPTTLVGFALIITGYVASYFLYQGGEKKK